MFGCVGSFVFVDGFGIHVSIVDCVGVSFVVLDGFGITLCTAKKYEKSLVVG